MSGFTAELASFAAGLRWDEVPEGRRETVRATFGNCVSLIVGASQDPAVSSIAGALTEPQLARAARVLGRDEKLRPLWAAFVHGFSAHLEDFDDTHLSSVVHPGAPVVPAALAAAELVDASGAEVMVAVAAGVEAALQIGNAVPNALERGWHMTGIAGPIGAAVAAGRVLGLSAAQLDSAIAVAATQAAGLTEALGTLTKPLHPGKAASNGLEAALLAANGFVGPAHSIEGHRGFLEVMGSTAEVHIGGSDWLLDDNVIKPYACGVLGHSVIDVARELRREVPEPSLVHSVGLRVNPLVLTAMGRAHPQTGLESKFSAVHSFTVGYLDGFAGPGQFTDERASDRDVQSLRSRVSAVADPTLARYEVHVTARLTDGSILHRQRTSPAELSIDGVRAKAMRLVLPTLARGASDFVRLAFSADSVETLGDLYRSARAMTPIGLDR